MSTRAINYLQKRGVSFQSITYDHEEKGAAFAARAIDFPLEKTVKTLVADLGGGRHLLVLMPGHKQLSLKRLAKAFDVKRAAMADVATAERLTGYLVGGISPFATKKPMASAIDADLLRNDAVVINAGQRGTMLKMTPGDIVSVLNCTVAELSQ